MTLNSQLREKKIVRADDLIIDIKVTYRMEEGGKGVEET